MMTRDELHPSELRSVGVCDADEYCVTPGERRTLNIHHAHDGMGLLVPVYAQCKGCARRSRKLARLKRVQK